MTVNGSAMTSIQALHELIATWRERAAKNALRYDRREVYHICAAQLEALIPSLALPEPEKAKPMQQFVNGYDAQFWYDSYKLLSDAVLEHLSDYVHDDDVAEEAIFVEAIKQAGEKLAALPAPPPEKQER